MILLRNECGLSMLTVCVTGQVQEEGMPGYLNTASHQRPTSLHLPMLAQSNETEAN